MKYPEKVSSETANKIVCVLVKYGMSEHSSRNLVSDLSERSFSRNNDLEFRFMGIFGFGGKVRYGTWDGFRADYYPESRTPELNEKMKELEAELDLINKEIAL